jgi:hypothetical protein
LAKSSICPGIITIIWSLITSDTGGADPLGNEIEPDDSTIEILNNKADVEKYTNIIKERSKQKQ